MLQLAYGYLKSQQAYNRRGHAPKLDGVNCRHMNSNITKAPSHAHLLSRSERGVTQNVAHTTYQTKFSTTTYRILRSLVKRLSLQCQNVVIIDRKRIKDSLFDIKLSHDYYK